MGGPWTATSSGHYAGHQAWTSSPSTQRARRWQTKEGMYRIKRQALPDVRDLSTMTMQLPLAQMSNRDGEAGMETMLWDISVIPNGTGQEIPYASSGSSTYECVGLLRTFHTFSPLVSPSKTLAVSLFVFVGVWGLGVVVALLCFCFRNPEFSAHNRPR